MPNNLHRWNVKVAPPSGLNEQSHLAYQQNAQAAPPTAVLVFHGIGEEIRFETLSRAASVILEQAEERGGTVSSVVVRSVPRNRDVTSLVVRAELGWTEKDGTPRQVHVYEVYWAPLTVGKISYLETIRFLADAGWNGLQGIFRSGKPFYFHRWLFGAFRALKIKSGTLLLILVLLAIIGTIFGAIAMVLSAVAYAGKEAATDGAMGFSKLATFIYRQISVPWNGIMQFTGNHFLLAPQPTWHPWLPTVLVFLVWIFAVWFAYWLRDIITQYAGSLVAYLSPYKDSKFEELRSQIQQVGLDAGNIILDGSCISSWIPKYERIVYVAHSLGSVLAYDTLNALININGAKRPEGTPNPTVLRTRAFITLGCPLDKTAFLFRAQLKVGENPFDEEGELRETMVGAVQPLISDLTNRYQDTRLDGDGKPIAQHGPLWINLWSSMDIISGKLAYYDNPDDVQADEQAASRKPPGKKNLSLVRNEKDRAAWIPLAAHNQYWKTDLMRRTVYHHLFDTCGCGYTDPQHYHCKPSPKTKK